jgi:hypothetical protein
MVVLGVVNVSGVISGLLYEALRSLKKAVSFFVDFA